MKTLIAVIVALAVVGGGWYWYTTTSPSAQGPSTTTTTTDNPNGPDTTPGGGVNANVNGEAGIVASVAPTVATVNLTANGFLPKSVSIKKGGTVTFVNQGTGKMWIGAASHPTHTSYDNTTEEQHCAPGYTGPKPFDQCGDGSSFSFTFDKLGSWNYHNHLNSSQFGTVVVVE